MTSKHFDEYFNFIPSEIKDFRISLSDYTKDSNYSVSFSINELKISPRKQYVSFDSSQSIKGFDPYGKYLTIKMNDEVIDTFYNSKALIVYNDNDSSFYIKEGMKFTWEPDSLSQGILVDINAFKSDVVLENTWTVFAIQDNGSFTVTKEMLKKFPNKADVQFTFYRGNYKTVKTKNNQNISLLFYSQCYTVYQVLK